MAQGRSSRVRTQVQAGLVQSTRDNKHIASFSASDVRYKFHKRGSATSGNSEELDRFISSPESLLAQDQGLPGDSHPRNWARPRIGLGPDGRTTIAIERPRSPKWRKTIAWDVPHLMIFDGSTPTPFLTDTDPLCRIPKEFLRSCGVQDVHDVVRRIGEATVKEHVQLKDAEGNALEGLDVFAIDSLFLHPLETNTPLTIIEFPQGKSRFRAPNLNPSESTYSASSNATVVLVRRVMNGVSFSSP
ncbi:hypothetical protein U1Q18_044780 [Sarracenia purpurea var. burkii]